jgi:hypothetical protein
LPSPNDQCAAVARGAVELHTGWGCPATFSILVRDDSGLTPRLTAVLDPELEPATDYPAAMERFTSWHLTEHPGEPPWAFQLTYEGDSAREPAKDAPAEEHARHRAAVDAGRIASLPYARVMFAVWCVDVHGRGWRAYHFEDDPGVICEEYFQAGTIPATGMLRGLVRVAYATGMIAHGLPGPQAHPAGKEPRTT